MGFEAGIWAMRVGFRHQACILCFVLGFKKRLGFGPRASSRGVILLCPSDRRTLVIRGKPVPAVGWKGEFEGWVGRMGRKGGDGHIWR